MTEVWVAALPTHGWQARAIVKSLGRPRAERGRLVPGAIEYRVSASTEGGCTRRPEPVILDSGLTVSGNDARYPGVHLIEVVDGVSEIMTCVECGDRLSAERAGLGYDYCTKMACQDRRHRGVAVTAVGVNKSADSFVVADPEEIRRRGEAGEFARKDSALGLDYRSDSEDTSGRRHRAQVPPRAPRVPPPRRPARPPWTAEQEKVVRLYHDMGLSPRQIVERARQNTPRLGVTERLVIQVLSARGRR